MRPPLYLVGQHPDRGALWAAVEPNVRFAKAEVSDRRWGAYLTPFKSEVDARAALVAAGARVIEPETRRRQHGQA